MRYVKIGALALVVLLLGAAGFLIVSDRMGQPAPPDPASLIAKAGHYHARIERDNFGVPHISGPRDADVAFGLAFAHSEDDFATIQQVALAVRGQLAASEGPKAAVTDYLVHLFRVWETVNAKYESDIPPDLRRVLEAYADGVNYYAALHPDQVMRGLLPFTGKDVVAGFVFKLPFFYGLDHVLLKLTSPQGGAISNSGKSAFLWTDTPAAGRIERAWPWRPRARPMAPPGCWSIRTSPIPVRSPGMRRCSIAAKAGMWRADSFPGSPFMLHGHNQHLGWANTVNGPDLVDVYKLVINPANPNQYRLDGQWREFREERRCIRVKIWGPLIWTAHREVLWAEQGSGDEDRPWRLRHPLCRHGRRAAAAAIFPAQQGRQSRGMAGGHAPAGDPQHQLRLCRREGQYRLHLQWLVPGAEGRPGLAGHTARRPVRPDLAQLSAVRQGAADLESAVGLRLQFEQHAVPRHRARRTI